MDHYDYIICGAGLAGLSLAERLTDDSFADKRILLIDRSAKDTNDRTWSFWAVPSFDRYSSIYRKSWERLAFYAPDVEVINDASPYRYHTISGLDFYKYTLEKIKACSHIDLIQDTINDITDRGDHVEITTDDHSYMGSYAFDSIVKSFPDEEELFVWQHFLGWEVKLKEGTWDDQIATFMDFRVDQGDDTRFVYVLPFDKTSALVEATVFSKDLWTEEQYNDMLTGYMAKYVGHTYEVVSVEQGKIPMTTAPFSKGSARVIPIGTNNATVKPSSGYAFMRIQNECEMLTERIKQGKVSKVTKSRRFIAYDRTLLNVLLTHKESAQRVFGLMFQRNTYGQNLKFLDEETSLWEETKIFWTLPFWSFLRAFLSENVFSNTKPETVSNP